jgi:hypothetical protein
LVVEEAVEHMIQVEELLVDQVVEVLEERVEQVQLIKDTQLKQVFQEQVVEQGNQEEPMEADMEEMEYLLQ